MRGRDCGRSRAAGSAVALAPRRIRRVRAQRWRRKGGAWDDLVAWDAIPLKARGCDPGYYKSERAGCRRSTTVGSIALVHEPRRQPLGEPVKVDDNPRVRAGAYLSHLIDRPHAEFD